MTKNELEQACMQARRATRVAREVDEVICTELQTWQPKDTRLSPCEPNSSTKGGATWHRRVMARISMPQSHADTWIRGRCVGEPHLKERSACASCRAIARCKNANCAKCKQNTRSDAYTSPVQVVVRYCDIWVRNHTTQPRRHMGRRCGGCRCCPPRECARHTLLGPLPSFQQLDGSARMLQKGGHSECLCMHALSLWYGRPSW
jgi:hypothetical protein